MVVSTTDEAVAWKILMDHFEPTTGAKVIQFLNGRNLGLFMCRVNQAVKRKCDVEHKLQNLYFNYQMIKSLPVEFRATVEAIYRKKDEDFVPDKIDRELIIEENRLRLSEKDFLRFWFCYWFL